MTSFENKQNIAENESVSTKFREGHWSSQVGLCKNNHSLQREEDKGHSSVPQMLSRKQRNSCDIMQDEGQQLDSLCPSTSYSRLKPHLAHLKISASEIQQVPESGSAPSLKLFYNEEEIMEGPRTGMQTSVKSGREEDKTTPPDTISKQAEAAIHNQIEAVLENKGIRRHKKQPKQSKTQKDSPMKEKHQSQTEFVVGKPRQKKVAKKRVAHSQGEATVTKHSDCEEWPTPGRESGQEDTEMGPIHCLVKEEGEREEEDGNDELRGISDQGPPVSSSLNEEHLLPLDMGKFFTEEIGNAFQFHTRPISETSAAIDAVASTADSFQADAVQGNQLSQDLLQHKEELRLARNRMIAEKAEKRHLAVERKRKEQEEQKRKEQEQREHLEKIREEMEQEQQRRMEEIRLRRQQFEEEHQRQEAEAARKQQAEKVAQEWAWQQQRERRQKLLEMQKKKQEEEQERAEAKKLRQKEMEMALKEEQRQLSEMAEEQRLEYEKRKKEEEEKRKLEVEERRRRTEEKSRIALEEARKQALLLARQRAKLETEHQFKHQLLIEARGLERRQSISRPWVYSYFQHPFFMAGKDN